MIKNILFDFDGVILDSMKIKNDGFLEIFKGYDADQLKKFSVYHHEHGGISRFEKIKFFFNHIVKKSITEEEIQIYAKKFGDAIIQNLVNSDNLIQDSLNFIKNNYHKYNFHIVSGAEHNELLYICQYLNLSQYFITIHGSPTKKMILIRNIIEKFQYKKDETIMIGDAFEDQLSAKENDIIFFGYNNIQLKPFRYINNFYQLEDFLKSCN
jgi:phosphoglycolate phosphatase-like HAD superfamily hydrolase